MGTFASMRAALQDSTNRVIRLGAGLYACETTLNIIGLLLIRERLRRPVLTTRRPSTAASAPGEHAGRTKLFDLVLGRNVGATIVSQARRWPTA